MRRRVFVAGGAALAAGAGVAWAQGAAMMPVGPESEAGAALVARLRAGGMVLFFRHADTIGEPCDRSYVIGDRAGQRNISPRGRAQAAAMGARLAALEVPVAWPVMAGPVFRARDTAELAFGAARVRVVEELLADDYAPGRVEWVVAAHRRLFSEPVPAGQVRVLVGHRTPGLMAAGGQVAERAFPEGGAMVIVPEGGGRFTVLGVLVLVPIEGAGFHGCG